jgi:heat shock protein HslJ/uncharacterized lipoprotein NlpE involved in copper resistance
MTTWMRSIARRIAGSAGIALLAATLVSAGCAGPSMKASDGPGTAAGNPDPAHNARNSLDWAGTYRGTLPCADCPGIETIVTLASDGTFRSRSKYMGRDGPAIEQQGTFSWNAAGNTVTLEGQEPVQYFVAENRLIRLARDGSRVTGPLAENYVLSRVEDSMGGDSVAGKRWRLVELNGRPVQKLEREPYFVLGAEGRVSGFGGCNVFTGTYELDEPKLRIRFGKLASTMLACERGMDVEKAFHQAMERADNFSRSGERLTLNRARMAPLAGFEAVGSK